jgi:hypothetical protein
MYRDGSTCFNCQQTSFQWFVGTIIPATSKNKSFHTPKHGLGSLLLVSSQLIHPTWMENQHIQEYRQKMLGMIDLT